MTKEQFKDLRIGDEVTVNTVHCKVVEVYPFQQIIMAKGNSTITKVIPFRYENCELVVKDKLVEFLCDNNHDGLTVNDNTFLADKIRSIVRKEVIDGLKFPSMERFGKYWNHHSYNDTIIWFIQETKKLNS